MSLDDLMEVWRSQDAAPLHGVNDTLLRLALRQDEAKLKARQRTERWTVYVMSALFVAFMVLGLTIMIFYDYTGWDFVIPIIGAIGILLWPGFVHTAYRAQVKREQMFGESLRDQLNRHIAQLDYQAKTLVSLPFHAANNLPVVVWSVAFYLVVLRFNGNPVSDAWNDQETMLVGVGTLLVCGVLVAASIWWQRQWVKRDLMPRKRRLEALLMELNGQ